MREIAKFGHAGFATDRDTLAAIYDRPDNIPSVGRRGGALYNFWKDADHPRGLWRRTTFESFRTPEPHWKILLDLDALAANEKEDWIWGGATTMPPAHDKVREAPMWLIRNIKIKRDQALHTINVVAQSPAIL